MPRLKKYHIEISVTIKEGERYSSTKVSENEYSANIEAPDARTLAICCLDAVHRLAETAKSHHNHLITASLFEPAEEKEPEQRKGLTKKEVTESMTETARAATDKTL